jgi:hypothetical protein
MLQDFCDPSSAQARRQAIERLTRLSVRTDDCLALGVCRGRQAYEAGRSAAPVAPTSDPMALVRASILQLSEADQHSKSCTRDQRGIKLAGKFERIARPGRAIVEGLRSSVGHVRHSLNAGPVG